MSFIHSLPPFQQKITSIATHDFILNAKRGDVLLLFLI
nr:MAG TPA: hypothetical protein [Caudoviricetes sp.]